MLPYLILGEDAYITIHDFLDQNVVIMAMLKSTGLMTRLRGIVPNMDGLDRSLFPFFTPFDVKMACYLLLPTYWAIIVYTFIYKVVAFVGMFLLVDSYIFKEKNRIASLLLSLGFALVPFYMELAISGAGFPLVIWAFLNLYYNRYITWSYISIAFYTFNSLLAYGGFFVLVLLSCFIVFDYLRTKELLKRVLYGFIFMSLVYVVANLGTIYSLFFSESFVSHRSEWVHSSTLGNDVLEFIKLLLFSQYHAGTLLALPILLLFIVVYSKYRKKYKVLPVVAILYCMVVGGILVGTLLKSAPIQLFVTIQFDRFYFFYPSVVYLLLFSICYVFIMQNQRCLLYLLVAYGLLCGVYFDTELKSNIRLLIGKELSSPSYRQFYDTELFGKIRTELKIPYDYTTKTVSVGLFPCVAEYNGFYTLDSYRVNYPIEYKRKFRKVISKELDKDDALKSNFDDWGSRCYVFSSELKEKGNQFLCSKKDDISVNNLDINTKALKELGCEYILSAVDIKNYKDLNLAYLNSYTTDQSYWNIRVYKLN